VDFLSPISLFLHKGGLLWDLSKVPYVNYLVWYLTNVIFLPIFLWFLLHTCRLLALTLSLSLSLSLSPFSMKLNFPWSCTSTLVFSWSILIFWGLGKNKQKAEVGKAKVSDWIPIGLRAAPWFLFPNVYKMFLILSSSYIATHPLPSLFCFHIPYGSQKWKGYQRKPGRRISEFKALKEKHVKVPCTAGRPQMTSRRYHWPH
jgi:hypothetical protein